MKKEYIKPSMGVVKLADELMITGASQGHPGFQSRSASLRMDDNEDGDTYGSDAYMSENDFTDD